MIPHLQYPRKLALTDINALYIYIYIMYCTIKFIQKKLRDRNNILVELTVSN